MKRATAILAGGFFAVLGCETPGTPDFTLEHRVSTPLLMEKTFQLIGDRNAFLDTTKSKMDSLFTIGGDGLVTLSQEFDLELGSFDEALPAVSIAPTTFRSEIGAIEISDFAANFGTVVGPLKQNPQVTDPVNIEFSGLPSGIVPAGPMPIGVQPDLQVANTGFNYALLENSAANPELNFILLELTNNTTIPMTNESRTGLPSITLRNADNAVLGGENVVFAVDGQPGATALAPGQKGTARLDLRGGKMTSVLRYSLSLGTTGGNYASGGSVSLKALTTELRFTEASANLDPQSGISLNSRTQINGDFVNAVIEDGYLNLTLLNETNFPLTLESLKVINTNAFKDRFSGRTIKAGTTVLETTNVLVAAKSQRVLSFPLDGRGISNDLTVEVNASTTGTTGATLVKSTDAFKYEIEGGLTVQSATAKIDAQTIRESQNFNFSNPEFNFNSASDYVRIRTGSLELSQLTNGIDLTVDTLIISFPTILIPKTPGVYRDSDSLVIELAGPTRLLRKRDNVPTNIIKSLAGAQIKAQNNVVRYNVFVKTENTKALTTADSVRTVNATDFVSATVRINNLELDQAIGSIATKTFVMGDDAGADGILDLNNAAEVQISEIEGLEGISENVNDIVFSDPRLNIFLGHNVGMDASVYLAVLGIDDNGNEVFLKPVPGGPFAVPANDPISGMRSSGVEINRTDLIRINLEKMTDINGTRRDQVFAFNRTTTNVGDFLSNLPSTIKVIGKAVLNPGGSTGFVKRPLTFTATAGIDIPVNFATASGPITVEDEIETDLSDLPGEGEDSILEEGSLFISYKNGLPLSMKVKLTFFDAGGGIVTVAPDPSLGSTAMTLSAGQVDPLTRFVSAPGAGVFTLGLTAAQLKVINKTRKIQLNVEMNTRDNQEIKLRAQDYLTIKVSANFKVATTIN